jgi:hypothetical protein
VFKGMMIRMINKMKEDMYLYLNDGISGIGKGKDVQDGNDQTMLHTHTHTHTHTGILFSP